MSFLKDPLKFTETPTTPSAASAAAATSAIASGGTSSRSSERSSKSARTSTTLSPPPPLQRPNNNIIDVPGSPPIPLFNLDDAAPSAVDNEATTVVAGTAIAAAAANMDKSVPPHTGPLIIADTCPDIFDTTTSTTPPVQSAPPPAKQQEVTRMRSKAIKFLKPGRVLPRPRQVQSVVKQRDASTMTVNVSVLSVSTGTQSDLFDLFDYEQFHDKLFIFVYNLIEYDLIDQIVKAPPPTLLLLKQHQQQQQKSCIFQHVVPNSPLQAAPPRTPTATTRLAMLPSHTNNNNNNNNNSSNNTSFCDATLILTAATEHNNSATSNADPLLALASSCLVSKSPYLNTTPSSSRTPGSLSSRLSLSAFSGRSSSSRGGGGGAATDNTKSNKPALQMVVADTLVNHNNNQADLEPKTPMLRSMLQLNDDDADELVIDDTPLKHHMPQAFAYDTNNSESAPNADGGQHNTRRLTRTLSRSANRMQVANTELFDYTIVKYESSIEPPPPPPVSTVTNVTTPQARLPRPTPYVANETTMNDDTTADRTTLPVPERSFMQTANATAATASAAALEAHSTAAATNNLVPLGLSMLDAAASQTEQQSPPLPHNDNDNDNNERNQTPTSTTTLAAAKKLKTTADTNCRLPPKAADLLLDASSMNATAVAAATATATAVEAAEQAPTTTTKSEINTSNTSNSSRKCKTELEEVETQLLTDSALTRIDQFCQKKQEQQQPTTVGLSLPVAVAGAGGSSRRFELVGSLLKAPMKETLRRLAAATAPLIHIANDITHTTTHLVVDSGGYTHMHIH